MATTAAATKSVSPSFKPGCTLRMTITKAPRARAARKTVERLMWRDPVVSKGLRKSHKVRQRSTVVYNRGNRDWVQRQECARIVEVTNGQTWTMVYHLDLANDIASVASYLQIEQA
ncbi:MAG: hypothetical protein ACK4WH_02030 [Phycisphaerales bacterium]